MNDHDLTVFERIDRKLDNTNIELARLTGEVGKVSLAQVAHEKLDEERFEGITKALEVRRAWAQLLAGIVLGAVVTTAVSMLVN